MTFLKKIVVGVLILESRLILAKYKPFIVAVTGSVGKTSTKDAIYSVLKKQDSFIRRSAKSMNSEIGLPLTVIGAPNAWHSIGGWLSNIGKGARLILLPSDYPHCLILEVGADHPGDIKKVSRWLNPDIAVITKVSETPVHVEFFSSPAEVFEEKASLARGVKKGGTVVLLSDDSKVYGLAKEAPSRDAKVMTFGTGDQASVRGTDYQVVPEGFSFKLNAGGNSVPVVVRNVVGRTFLYPLLAATAVGMARGMSLMTIIEALNEYEAPKGRMNVIPGINGSTIIDDTYNSSPDAAVSALDALKEMAPASAEATAGKRKIAVLGDMMELGKYSPEEHRKIGREAAGAVNMLVTVGPRSRDTADEAVKKGLNADVVRSFATSQEAAAFLVPLIQTGDIVLVKGSQSVRMERVSKALLREPERAKELLVRQEREWLEKK